jgi:hypothetical protein
MTGLVEYTERLVRREIASWPDGTATFTDYLDSDGIERADVRITATVRIEGDEITADLTDCAPMVRGSLNSTRSFIEACVYQAVRCALTVEIPNTSGRIPADPRADEARHDRRGRDARRVVDARRHRVPGARRRERRTRAARADARARGRRGRQHARHLRRRPARTAAAASSSTSSSSAPGAARRKTTATTG